MGAGALHCNCCLEDTKIDARPQLETGIPDEALVDKVDAGLWEEVLPEESGAQLCNQLREVAAKPTCISGRGQLRLEFLIGPGSEVGLQLRNLALPVPALVVQRVDPEGQMAITADGNPGICPGDTIAEVQGRIGTPDELLERLSRCRRARSNGSCIGSGGAADADAAAGDAAVNSAVEPPLPIHLSLAVWPRPSGFSVILRRQGLHWRRLGLSVALRQDKRCILIAAVHEAGLAAEWNLQNNQFCLCSGDRVLAVNEVQGDVFRMYALVQATSLGGVLRLHVEPPPRAVVPRLEVNLVARV